MDRDGNGNGRRENDGIFAIIDEVHVHWQRKTE